MTDIVERLRDPLIWPDIAILTHEAADEIERLRAALEIIAGRRQCLDNLMGNVAVACEALDGGKP